MEPDPRKRRWSRELPPDLSELMNTLIKCENELIRQFDSSEDEMRRIVGEFQEIVDEVREMKKNTDMVRTAGSTVVGLAGILITFSLVGLCSWLAAAAGGTGDGVIGLIIDQITGLKSMLTLVPASRIGEEWVAVVSLTAGGLAGRGALMGLWSAATGDLVDPVKVIQYIIASFTAGLSYAARTIAESSAVVLAAALAAGGAAVVGANVTKMKVENRSLERAEKLGKYFMNIVESMKKTLEEIKTTCEELEERSSEVQAEETLRNMEEFTDVLRRVSELKTKSNGVLEIITAAITSVGGLLRLLFTFFRVTPTSEEDEKLRASFIQSADQCEKVIDELKKMKDKVKDFTGK